MTTDKNNLIKRFLLGELSEEQRAEIENKLFTSDEFYEEVLAEQEELADECVNSSLTPNERARLEEYFSRSPRRAQRVEFAAALSQAIAPPQSKPAPIRERASWSEALVALFRPRWTLAASVVAITLLVISGWLWIQNQRLENQIKQSQNERASLLQRSSITDEEAARKAKDLEGQIAVLKAEGGDLKANIAQKERELEELRRINEKSKTKPSGKYIAFILSPGLTRGNDEPDKLLVPTSATNLNLQLDLDAVGNYRGFVAEIRTARGNLIWSKSGLTLRKTSYGHAVFTSVPSAPLLNGEYELTLKGVGKGRGQEVVGYYYFIIQKR